MVKTLASDIRSVIAQFAYTNESLMPSGISLKAETIEQFVAKSSAVRGEQILDPTNDIGALPFTLDLLEAGYELVDAFSRRQSKNGRPFFTTRFVFAQREHAHSSEAFLAKKDAILVELTKMVTEAMWRARSSCNPFFCEGEMIPDVDSASVNFEARSPLFDGSGKPLVRWQRDEAGEKVGDAPFPLKPSGFLRIQDEGICVVDE